MTKLFAPKQSRAKLPEPAPVAPVPDEDQLAETRKRGMRRQVQMQGTPATILSTAGSKETLGS